MKEVLISVINLTYATLITSQRNLNPKERIQSPNPTPAITKMSLIIASLFSGEKFYAVLLRMSESLII
jgi:hypothetical protein